MEIKHLDNQRLTDKIELDKKIKDNAVSCGNLDHFIDQNSQQINKLKDKVEKNDKEINDQLTKFKVEANNNINQCFDRLDVTKRNLMNCSTKEELGRLE